MWCATLRMARNQRRKRRTLSQMSWFQISACPRGRIGSGAQYRLAGISTASLMITLTQYINHRLGATSREQAINFLGKPFGARSPAEFWQYWNPVWSYFLLFYLTQNPKTDTEETRGKLGQKSGRGDEDDAQEGSHGRADRGGAAAGGSWGQSRCVVIAVLFGDVSVAVGKDRLSLRRRTRQRCLRAEQIQALREAIIQSSGKVH